MKTIQETASGTFIGIYAVVDTGNRKAFIAFTLLLGHQEERPACKN